MRTIKLMTCPTCHGKRVILVPLTGGGALRVPCTPCSASGKVFRRC